MPSWWPFGKKEAEKKEGNVEGSPQGSPVSDWGSNAHGDSVVYKRHPKAPVTSDVVVDPFGRTPEDSPTSRPAGTSPAMDSSPARGSPGRGKSESPAKTFLSSPPPLGSPALSSHSHPEEPYASDPESVNVVPVPRALTRRPSAARGWVNEVDPESPVNAIPRAIIEAHNERVAAIQRKTLEDGDKAVEHAKRAKETQDKMLGDLKVQGEVLLQVNENMDELEVQIKRAKKDLKNLANAYRKDKCCIIIVIVAAILFVMLIVISGAKPGGGGSPPTQDVILLLPPLLSAYNGTAMPTSVQTGVQTAIPTAISTAMPTAFPVGPLPP